MEAKTNNDIAWYSVFKPSWYVSQMKGWSTKSYMLLLAGLGIIFGMTIAGPLNSITILTLLAGMLGYTCTLSITNAKPLNGVLGLTSAIIYIIVAIHAKNFNDVLLQTVYILTLDLPVLLMPSWAKDVDKKVRFLHEKGHGLRNWLLTILFFIVVLITHGKIECVIEFIEIGGICIQHEFRMCSFVIFLQIFKSIFQRKINCIVDRKKRDIVLKIQIEFKEIKPTEACTERTE